MRSLTVLPALLAATAALAACAGSAEPAPPTVEVPAATQPPATTEAEEPAPTTEAEEPPATTEAEEPAATTEAEEPAATIRLEGGEPVGGQARIEVRRGDTVRIRIRSDIAEEIHVHGYDLTLAVGPGQPSVLTFVAELEGIFDIEAHESGAQVAELVVNP